MVSMTTKQTPTQKHLEIATGLTNKTWLNCLPLEHLTVLRDTIAAALAQVESEARTVVVPKESKMLIERGSGTGDYDSGLDGGFEFYDKELRALNPDKEFKESEE